MTNQIYSIRVFKARLISEHMHGERTTSNLNTNSFFDKIERACARWRAHGAAMTASLKSFSSLPWASSSGNQFYMGGGYQEAERSGMHHAPQSAIFGVPSPREFPGGAQNKVWRVSQLRSECKYTLPIDKHHRWWMADLPDPIVVAVTTKDVIVM